MAVYKKAKNVAIIIDDKIHVLMTNQSVRGVEPCNRCSVRDLCVDINTPYRINQFSSLCYVEPAAHFVNLSEILPDLAHTLVDLAIKIQDYNDLHEVYKIED